MSDTGCQLFDSSMNATPTRWGPQIWINCFCISIKTICKIFGKFILLQFQTTNLQSNMTKDGNSKTRSYAYAKVMMRTIAKH